MGERVLFVIGSLDRGGAEGQLIELSAGLVERGWDATILCLTHEGAQAARARARGVEVVLGRFQGTGARSPRPLARAIAHARGVIAHRRPDVVHTHLEWSNVIGTPAARLARVPVVVGSRLQLRDIVYAKHFETVVRWADAVSSRLSNAVVCNSMQVLQDAVGAGVPVRKAHMIHNGVAIPPFEPPPSGGSRIAAIANLHPYKGHRYLIEAFGNLLARPEIRDDPPTLELAGAGVEEAALRAQVRALGLVDRVRFLGSVDDVQAMLGRCAFTVLPSLSEGLPNAVLESIALGRPVVASDVGGIPEILGDGGGILVPPGDVGALERAMARLVTSPAERRSMGDRAREIAVALFSIEALVDRHEELYRLLLAERRVPIGARA